MHEVWHQMSPRASPKAVDGQGFHRTTQTGMLPAKRWGDRHV
jgi:hypothetical protein